MSNFRSCGYPYPILVMIFKENIRPFEKQDGITRLPVYLWQVSWFEVLLYFGELQQGSVNSSIGIDDIGMLDFIGHNEQSKQGYARTHLRRLDIAKHRWI